MPRRYRLSLGDVQLEAESLGYGWFRNGGGVIERPKESKAGVTTMVREDRGEIRPFFSGGRD